MEPLLDPLLAIVAGYAALVLASARGARAYTSIAVMILVFALLASTPPQALEAARRLIEWNDIRVFVYIFLSLLLAGLMREKGHLRALVESTGSVGCRFSLLSVPAIIGLIPMPGGALVSAIALRDRFFRDARLSRENATFINYWFRHLWVPSWPLFQSVVITASVLAVDPLDVVSHTWPSTPAAIIGGLIVAAPILWRLSCPNTQSRGAVKRFLWSTWPLLVLAALFISSREGLGELVGRVYPLYAMEPMLASLILVIALFALAHKPTPREIVSALRLATKPTIHLVLLESLYFKNLIILSPAGESVSRLATTLSLPTALIVVGIPFLMGLAAGGENFFASTAIPLLLPYLAAQGGIEWGLVALAYAGGFLGVMASPVHLCLVLTAEYYEASLGKTLLLVLASVAVSLVLAAGAVWALYRL